MEKSSEFAEREMSEVASPVFNEREKARDLIRDIAGHCWDSRSDMIDRVYDVVRRHFPRATWTRRRIRSLWHREAAGVRWGEMRELEFVAEIERSRRLQIEQAKAEHAEFITRIGTTLDRLAVSDAAFHREHMEALRSLAGGSVDLPERVDAGQGAPHPARRSGFRVPDSSGDFK